MAAVAPDKAVVHRGWSGADHPPAELQVNRARACVLMNAASNFTIGPQRLPTYPNGLSNQAQRSQAQEHPNYACSLADLHFLSFRPEFLFCTSGRSKYTSDHPWLCPFSCASILKTPSGRKGSRPEN